jgi:hypothetical protein
MDVAQEVEGLRQSATVGSEHRVQDKTENERTGEPLL